MSDNELYEVTLASVDGQKLKAHKVILSASSISFKKLLVNNLNCHTLIFIRKIENESHLIHSLILKERRKKTCGALCDIFQYNKTV